jgi:hypothetical protein
MLWDTTLASNVGYMAALLYNQNNVSSMASGVTLQLEREVSRYSHSWESLKGIPS